jgi:cell wall-associated NlpC family hydrolase
MLPADWSERDARGCYEAAIVALKADPAAAERWRRGEVLAEAREWIGTPYHHMGRVKGIAADCLTLLAEVYGRCGIVPHVEIPFYPPDWFLHRDEERYIDGLLRHAREVEGPPRPADIAVFKFGRCFAHGAIVTAWPMLIHSFVHTGVVAFSAEGGMLLGRPVRFFDPFARR